MGRSFDDLIGFLLNEIALCGEEGMAAILLFSVRLSVVRNQLFLIHDFLDQFAAQHSTLAGSLQKLRCHEHCLEHAIPLSLIEF